MSTQTVYFNNPADITKIQGQIGTTAGQVTISSANGSSTITNLESQVDQMLINRQLELFAPSLRIIPHINPDKTFWFSANDNWTITSGLTGSSSSGAFPFNYDTDYTFSWTGANNVGTVSTFNMVLNVPSLSTGPVLYNVFSTAGAILATGTASPLTQGAMQKVTFKYKGQGQNANQPIIQSTTDIAVVLPPDFLSATGHNLIIGINGNGQASFETIQSAYMFPPYDPVTYPTQFDTTLAGFFPTSLAYQMNFNTGASTQLGATGNLNSSICLSIPNDTFDFQSSSNGLEESGEFFSFMREWLSTFKVGSVNKTIVKSHLALISAGGVTSINPFDNYLWAGIRFNVDSIFAVSTCLANYATNTIENSYLSNVYGSRFIAPNPEWLQNFPRTSVCFITGKDDNLFCAPSFSTLFQTTAYFYGLTESAKVFRQKFGLNPTISSTGTVFSNTGVYSNLSMIIATTGLPNQYAPYPVTNPIKYSGEDTWCAPGMNTATVLTQVLFPLPTSFATNPINVYSIFLPNSGHGPSSNFASGYGIDTGYPLGWDFTPIYYDFINKLL